MPNFISLIGKSYGRLTVVERAPNSITKSGRKLVAWVCRCSCGNTTIALAQNLQKENTKSCGCLRAEPDHLPPPPIPRHGHAGRSGNNWSPTYRSWQAMTQRCRPETTNRKYRRDYVDLGVTVCERWKIFENFLADMGERPDGKTLDRYPDPAGNYEPTNCRWATALEQAANKRR